MAWRRDDVADLNRLARDRYDQAGHLTGPDLVAPGGRAYAADDRVVALAPIPTARIVTSQQLTITGVDPDHRSLTVRTGDGRDLILYRAPLSRQRCERWAAPCRQVTCYLSVAYAESPPMPVSFPGGGPRERRNLVWRQVHRREVMTSVGVHRERHGRGAPIVDHYNS